MILGRQTIYFVDDQLRPRNSGSGEETENIKY